MKSLIKYSVVVVFIAGIAIGCNKLPEYPVEPSITFNDVYFKKGDLADSLFVVLDFKDGDGDLGLDENYDTEYPYQTFWYFLKNDGSYLTYEDRNTPPYDTLPPYEFPYYCTNYSEESDGVIYYVQPNENHYNYFIDFYVKKNGSYDLFDWYSVYSSCDETYNGRYPILNESGKERPLEGKLIYKITGARIENIFKRDTLRLEIYIKDRALHNSNTVQSFDFVLKDITIN
mgnify:CR=1 FL=1